MTGSSPTLADRNVLVVAHRYSHFTKAQVDELARHVGEVHVFVRYNRFTDLSRVLDWEPLKQYGTHDKVVSESPRNVTVHTTPLTYVPTDLWYRYLGRHHYWAVRRQVEHIGTDFDLVHSHFTWTAGYVGTRLAEDLGVPSVVTVHEDVDRLDEELSWGNGDLEWTLERSDAIVRVTERDCDRLEAYNDAVYAIPNGYDRDRFPLVETGSARDDLGLGRDDAVVFSLGTLTARKRPTMLIEAVSTLDLETDVVCAIAGRGERRDAVERAAAAADGPGLDVRVLGYLPDEAVARWMNACDVFALASRSEGNPTVLFEALGCGKPYVGTNVGGVGEIVTSDRYGRYCAPNSVDDLATIVEEGLRTEWDREAILAYAERFTWAEIVDRVLDVYESLWTDTPRVTPTGSRGH